MKKEKRSLVKRVLNRLGLATIDQYRDASLQMAVVNRLTASWTTTTLSPDSQARLSLAIVRARSRQLVQDNDYAQKFLTMCKTNILGEAGMHFRSGAKNPDLVKNNVLIPGAPDAFARKVIEDQWYQWGRKETCTVHGTMTWCDVERTILETTPTDGESIVRKIKGANNPFGFTLQFYDAEQLDDTHNERATNGNEIRMGVEFNSSGRPVAYHLLRQTPSENYYWRGSRTESDRVPAEEIIHLGIRKRHNQSRFLPWFSTAGYRLNMVGKYEEAEVTAARIAACKNGFFTRENSSAEYGGEVDSDGNKTMETQPGTWEELAPGLTPHTVDWQHPNSAYGVFLKTALRGVASGLGVSYSSLANDMESVNFASGKLGLFEERELWKALQNWLIESFHEEIFKAWLESAMLAGAVPLPFRKFDKFNTPIFRGRRWAHIDPVKETSAEIDQLNSGLTSHSRILATRGIERDELFDEIAADKEAMKARDIEPPELQAKAPPVNAVDDGGTGQMNDDVEDNEDT